MFVSDKSKKDGYTYECKDCRNELQNERMSRFKDANVDARKRPCPECHEHKFPKFFFTTDGACRECFCRRNGHHKQCFTCKQVKTPDNFIRVASNTDGLSTYCRACEKADRDRKRAEQREKNKNHNKKQCLGCLEYLKYNMFFRDGDAPYDRCMKCYEPASLQCTRCHDVKTTSEFSLDASKRTGFRTICRPCSSKRHDAPKNETVVIVS
jgi:hypothetical protein